MRVFENSYAEQYDVMYAEKDYGAECDLVASTASSRGVTIDRLLDIGCGTGGHSLEWARRGVGSVTGIDFSPAMIAQAKAKAASIDISRRPDFQIGNATTFEAGEAYDVATMMFAVLGYMNTNEEVIAALRNVRRHLRPGGVFSFDVWYGPAVLSVRPEPRTRVIRGADGLQTIRSASTEIDSSQHLAFVTFDLWTIRGDRFEGASRERHSMRYFFPQELRFLLGAAGFDEIEIQAFPDGGPPDDKTWNVYCSATAV